MSDIDYQTCIASLLPAVREAGAAIMDVYRAGVQADEKDDGSPVTQADRLADKILTKALRAFSGDIPIVCEEDPATHTLKDAPAFWLVDPLDGTREFVKADGKGAFTVNVGLVENGLPTMGIIYAPAIDRLFVGDPVSGVTENGKKITRKSREPGRTVALASVSHRDAQTDAWLSECGVSDIFSVGSSLKFGMLALGEADMYPRFSPTMEWDTAAGQAILQAAGGRVTHPDGSVFRYGKANFRNGPFIAYAR
ncbi:MAG: 3'(2'),5'-bisphosphate nucleotidase CysQ [Pseudomonadota bacterium]